MKIYYSIPTIVDSARKLAVMPVRNKRISSVLVALAGWYGSTAIITGYALLTLGGLSSDSTLFLLLNLTGAIGLMIVSFAKKVISLVVLNVFWMFVAIAGLLLR